MVEFATENDIGAIGALWQRVFDEDKAVTDDFFESVYRSCHNPVIKSGGEIVSSLFLIPCRVKEHRGFCVYCAMTDNNHRGKGYMRSLLDFSYNSLSGLNGEFLVLVPAEKSLFGYYEKCGFSPFGQRNSAVLGKDRPVLTGFSKSDCELTFDSAVTEYWKRACVHYGGELINGEFSALAFKSEKTVLKNARGGYVNIPEKYRKPGVIIEGDVDFGSRQTPAMIKTADKRLASLRCFVGVTLE